MEGILSSELPLVYEPALWERQPNRLDAISDKHTRNDGNEV